MAIVSGSDVRNIKQASARLYARLSGATDWDYLGWVHEDGISINLSMNINGVKSAESGEGEIAAFSSGDSVAVECKLREFNKFVLARYIMPTMSATGVSLADGQAGKLGVGREAGMMIPTFELKIFPRFINSVTGVQMGDDVNNMYVMYISKARSDSEPELLLSPSEPTEFNFSCIGQYNFSLPNGERLFTIDSGHSL